MKYSTGIVEKDEKFYSGLSMIAVDFVPVDPFVPSTRYYVDSVLWDDKENRKTHVLMVNKPMQEEREGCSQTQTYQHWAFGYFHRVGKKDLRLELVQWWPDDKEDISVERITTEDGRKMYEHLLNENGYVPHVGFINATFFEETFLGKDGPSKKVLWISSEESDAVYSHILSIDGRPAEINLVFSDDSRSLAKASDIDERFLFEEAEWLTVGLPQLCIDNRGQHVIYMKIEDQRSGLVLLVFTSEALAKENRWIIAEIIKYPNL